LDISAILKKANKQKQMIYMGYVDNISAFDGWRNMLDRQRYRRFCKSLLFRQKSILPVCAAILNSKFSNSTVLIDTRRTNKMHIRFLKFVDFWPFGSENKIFSFLSAILDFAAILDYSSKI
jgi:hypothetical protein